MTATPTTARHINPRPDGGIGLELPYAAVGRAPDGQPTATCLECSEVFTAATDLEAATAYVEHFVERAAAGR